MKKQFLTCWDTPYQWGKKPNKGIVEATIEEETEYEEASHMMESNSISLGDLQGEEFTVDNENEDVKGDWVLLIIKK